MTVYYHMSAHIIRKLEHFGPIRNDLLERDSHMKDVLLPYTVIQSKPQPIHFMKLLTRAKFFRIGRRK